ncbi:hypothetical protein [Thermofilum pendens]|uniref:Uncharacterized protein n=1 Tax=Thermofilum pendens (strain DSM 2475 / Hrk 5) TaxID=368408 RepID=A1RZ43_THEPD|nr:hypothetical protein [Thermofilum pendens]ABL78473.1 hypothetical protein Tpen_1074 [Thermofilum pendens Hrk 5]
MIEELLSVLGAVIIVGALYSKRVSLSLLLLSLGTVLVAMSIGLLVGATAGILVATVFAGALVALLSLWLIVTEKEEARADSIYVVAAVFFVLITVAFAVLLAFAYRLSPVPVILRKFTAEDAYLLLTLLLVSVTSSIYVLRGDRVA